MKSSMGVSLARELVFFCAQKASFIRLSSSRFIIINFFALSCVVLLAGARYHRGGIFARPARSMLVKKAIVPLSRGDIEATKAI